MFCLCGAAPARQQPGGKSKKRDSTPPKGDAVASLLLMFHIAPCPERPSAGVAHPRRIGLSFPMEVLYTIQTDLSRVVSKKFHLFLRIKATVR